MSEARRRERRSSAAGARSSPCALPVVPERLPETEAACDTEVSPAGDGGWANGPAGARAGMRVGRYTILRRVGRGGQGEVFLAQDSRRRVVALKTLAGVAHSAERLERFRNEALTAARLDHPGIVKAHEVFEHEGVPFIAMEYVAGMSLADAVKSGRFARPGLIEIVAAVCEAAAFAHSAGIIHLDLKPQNILVCEDGTPKIADFGLATSLHEERRGLRPARDCRVQGTPAYMSPEQAEGAHERVSSRSDVYALGAILYQCLTGSLPRGGSTPREALERAIARDPAPPIERDPSIGAELNAVCVKAMMRDPRDRYAGAAEMAADLRACLTNRPPQAATEKSGTGKCARAR